MNKQILILCTLYVLAAFICGCQEPKAPPPLFKPRVEVSIIENADSVVLEVNYLYGRDNFGRDMFATTKIRNKEQLDLYTKDVDLLQKKLQEVQSKMTVPTTAEKP